MGHYGIAYARKLIVLSRDALWRAGSYIYIGAFIVGLYDTKERDKENGIKSERERKKSREREGERMNKRARVHDFFRIYERTKSVLFRLLNAPSAFALQKKWRICYSINMYREIFGAHMAAR